MIDGTEVESTSRQFGVPESQVRRDHLISHVLDALANSSTADELRSLEEQRSVVRGCRTYAYPRTSTSSSTPPVSETNFVPTSREHFAGSTQRIKGGDSALNPGRVPDRWAVWLGCYPRSSWQNTHPTAGTTPPLSQLPREIHTSISQRLPR